MKSALALAAAFALCGTAFAATPGQHARGVVNTVKQDAKQIGSSARRDFRRIVRGDKFRQEQAADRGQHSPAQAMGAGGNAGVSSDRQARMDAAYANWQRTSR
ncbi:hypothetical protein HK414_24455 [Ramlibacter terrae]|uniref:DUF4148 domain-containing protein n=1 Tax=Ramlibacter terrae TaxID=2732511 RepID=A0ABX6P8U2_9BURK|nr:hypothetical protein HK414_24455 [Ramlibacter terrae]